MSVLSETGRLRKVIIHRPGPEWDLVPCGPGALTKYLIEDIFVLSKAQEEHDCLTKVLRLFLGPDNVIDFSHLLTTVCHNANTRLELIGAVTALESLGLKTVEALASLKPADLADVLVRGAVISESQHETYENIFPPLPNLMFTRDIGVSVPRGFILAHAATPTRRRETLLMRYVLRHPIFKDVKKLDIISYQNEIFWHNLRGGEAVSLEGGDLLVLNKATLFVGTGERTTETGFFLLLDLLQSAKSPIKTVIRAVLPSERASMHLDTVITAIGHQQFMVYGPVVDNLLFEVYRRPFKRSDKNVFNFSKAMQEAGFPEVQSLDCGGSYQVFRSREQWTDGANLLAIAPGVLLGYDRNKETASVLKGCGYKYFEPHEHGWQDLMDLATRFQQNGKTEEKILVGLPGSELSRARGGPRCMTMPLVRDSIVDDDESE